MAQLALWTVLLIGLIYVGAFYILGGGGVFEACGTDLLSTFGCFGQFIILDIDGVDPVLLTFMRLLVGLALIVIVSEIVALFIPG